MVSHQFLIQEDWITDSVLRELAKGPIRGDRLPWGLIAMKTRGLVRIHNDEMLVFLRRLILQELVEEVSISEKPHPASVFYQFTEKGIVFFRGRLQKKKTDLKKRGLSRGGEDIKRYRQYLTNEEIGLEILQCPRGIEDIDGLIAHLSASRNRSV